jgi:hypothetical protein
MRKLKSFLKSTYEALKENRTPHWWDPERVAAVMIKNSADNYTGWDKSKAGLEECDREIVPCYQPCGHIQSDIQYLYRVILDRRKQGKATIQSYSVEKISSDFDEITRRNPIEVEIVDYNKCRQ